MAQYYSSPGQKEDLRFCTTFLIEDLLKFEDWLMKNEFSLLLSIYRVLLALITDEYAEVNFKNYFFRFEQELAKFCIKSWVILVKMITKH